MEINDITGEIVRAAMKVHTALGAGLFESTYRVCLAPVSPVSPVVNAFDVKR